MKKILSIFSLVTAAVLLFTGCTRIEDLPYHEKGAAVTLTADKNAVVATAADSTTNVVTFSWSDPKYATDTANYKFLLQIDSAGKNFANAFTKEVMGQRSVSLTGRELNAVVLDYGFALGTAHTLDIRVISSYKNNNERYTSNIVKLSVTPYADPSVLTSTANTVTGSLATADQNALTFNWNPSFAGYAGTVTYTLQYDSAGKNFSSPQEINVGASLLSKAMTQGEVNQNALNEGIAGGTSGKIEYRVKATTAQGAIAYSNAVAITVNTYVPFYNMYIVGSMNGWDINNAWEIISDRGPGRWGKVFYTYVQLNAGDAFLFVKKLGDWNSKHGSTGGGTGGVYDIGAPGTGADFTVSASGIYRLTIDLNANKAYIQQKQVGVVGNMQGWNPGSPIYGGLAKRDLFVILTPSNGTDEFKFHDGPVWDNSSPDKARWWGRGASAGVLDFDGNGPNLVANGSPRARAIWNGTDPQSVKYDISPAAEMRLVGDGIDEPGVNDWDPGSSPQMTYAGNGVWTITVNLKANKSIKFLAGNAWGAFDYEDASGGSQAVGTPRAIKWDGGPDFKTPAVAGSYTITLNEYTQTVTIN